jgi:hypothetical protein
VRGRKLQIATLLSCVALPSSGQTVRDSAGIQIVENVAPIGRRAWHLSGTPTLSIGGGDAPAEKIGRVAGATRLSDGRVLVADESSVQFKFYDASGRHLGSVDAKGQGAGELRNLPRISKLAGDSIAVPTRNGESIFSPNGAFARNVQFGPFAPGTLQSPFVFPLGRFHNGTIVVGDFPQGQRGLRGARQWVDSSSLFLVDRNGAIVRPLGNAPIVVFVGGSQPSPMDFGPQASYASTGREFFWGFGEDYAVRVYDEQWKLKRIIRRAWTPRRLTPGEIDAYVDGWMQMWSKKTGAERDAERKEMRESAYPEFLPAYSALLVTETGELWVRDPDLTGAPGCWCLAGLSTVPSKWSVFDPQGRWIAEVAMPPRFIPLEVGENYVLGRSRDADTVSRVVMYRIEKPR